MLVGMIALGWGAAPAMAAEPAEIMEVKAVLADTGQLTVTTTWVFAQAAPQELSQSFALGLDQGDGSKLILTLDDISADADGQPLEVSSNSAGDNLTISLETGGAQQVSLTYSVWGVTQADLDGSIRVRWDVLQGLSIDVSEITGQLALPGEVIDYFCESGLPQATRTCNRYSGGLHGSTALTFSDGPRAAGEVVTIGAFLKPGAAPVTAVFSQPWSVGRAFQPGWARVGAAAGIALAGGLILLRVSRRHGARGSGTVVAELTPNAAGHTVFTVHHHVRPGMIGTLVDHSVDPVDIVASILDLAARGHLWITQLPRSSDHTVPDWELTRRPSDDRLEEYEVQLLNVIAPTDAAVRVSQLTGALAPAVAQVQGSLYKCVLSAGWFARLPGGRNRWPAVAWAGLAVALAVTATLAAWTTWALVGLGLVAVALVGVAVAGTPPVLTARGESVLAGLAGLAGQLHAAETDLAPGQAAAVLPYAIVLGGWSRWLDALAPPAQPGAGQDQPAALDWYQAPPGWRPQDLPLSLDAFITVLTGRLFTRP